MMVRTTGEHAARKPRDVLADRIEKWIDGTDRPYDYADRLITDLDTAGYDITPATCLADGCGAELGAFCEDHGYVLYGWTEADRDADGHPVPGKARMERTVSFREDIAAVLTVYDEHVPPADRGPWYDRLALFVELDVMDRVATPAASADPAADPDLVTARRAETLNDQADRAHQHADTYGTQEGL